MSLCLKLKFEPGFETLVGVFQVKSVVVRNGSISKSEEL